MKYTILGFQQKKLMDLKLDATDALILRTIKDMYSSAGMEFVIHDYEKYIWLNQKYFFNQIPIVGSRSTLLRRIDNMVDKGLIEKLLKHSKKGVKGNFSYIKTTIKLDELEEYDPYVKMKQPLCQNETTLMSKRNNKDTSIKDTSIKDTKDSGGGKFREIIQIFENNGFGMINSNTKDRLVDLSSTYTEDWLIDALLVAVDSNVRKISYVEGILKTWKAEGKDAGKPKEKSQWEYLEEF